MASMGEQTARRYAPLLVAALVLVAVGGTWLALHRGSGSATGAGAGGDGGVSRRPLQLVGWTPAGDGTADPRYSLAAAADLPAGPGSAEVHRVLAADDGDLRSALGRLAASLAVAPDGQWSTGSPTVCAAVPPDAPVPSDAVTGPDAGIGADGGTASDLPCARDQLHSGDATGPPLPGRDAVLSAVGLAGDADGGRHDISRVAQPDGSELYQLDPVVSGRPTVGLRTVLVGTPDGRAVTSGAGWLVRTPADGDYPVVSAADAFQLLRRTPLPMPLMACPEPLPQGADPVPCGGPVTVTGARLGLSMQQSADGYLLVPAWLFTVDGSQNPLVQVAVQPRLVEPAELSGGGTSGGSSGSTGSGGSAVPPAAPSVAPTDEPVDPIPGPRSRFTAVTPGADHRTLDVAFWGGVEACYAYDVRAVEDDHRVRIWLEQRTPKSDKPCIDLAQERHDTVTLQQPLGLRTVEDGDSGAVLLGPAT